MSMHLEGGQHSTNKHGDWFVSKEVIGKAALKAPGIKNRQWKRKGLYKWMEELHKEVRKNYLYLHELSLQRPKDQEWYQGQYKKTKHLLEGLIESYGIDMYPTLSMISMDSRFHPVK